MTRQQRIILIGIAVAFILIGSFIFLVSRMTPTSQKEGVIYTDPGSGEMVYDNSDLSQSSIDNPTGDTITYLGFSFLSEIGLTQEQIAHTKATIQAYSEAQSEKFTEVSLDKSSVRQIMPSGTSSSITVQFNVTANRETVYYVTTEYDAGSFVVTKLYSDDKTELLFTN